MISWAHFYDYLFCIAINHLWSSLGSHVGSPMSWSPNNRPNGPFDFWKVFCLRYEELEFKDPIKPFFVVWSEIYVNIWKISSITCLGKKDYRSIEREHWRNIRWGVEMMVRESHQSVALCFQFLIIAGSLWPCMWYSVHTISLYGLFFV